MKTTTKKPTKKQLEQPINEVTVSYKDGNNVTQHEALDHAELMELFNISPRILALAIHLELTLEDTLNELSEGYNEECIEYGSEEYRVLTDSEADDANDENIESYIDECILPELPERYRFYFDNEAFKKDARMDGRGHNLASYDGNEEEVKVDETYYFIYRTN